MRVDPFGDGCGGFDFADEAGSLIPRRSKARGKRAGNSVTRR